MAPAGTAQGRGRARRQVRAPQRVLRDHAQRGAGGDRAAARDRRGAREGLPRPPRARLSGRLQPLAAAVEESRSVGRVGGPRAEPRAAHDLRARGGDRRVRAARVLDARGRVREGVPVLQGAPHRVRRREGRAVHDHVRSPGRGSPPRPRAGRGRHARRRERREEAAQAQPVAALHDLDPAAGSRAQARLRCAADHAHRAEALRGRRLRRRADRPHHLHAHGLREPRRRGDRRHPRCDRAAVRCRRGARRATAVPHEVEERAGGTRGRSPDFGLAHAGAARGQARSRPAPPLHAHLAPRGGEPDGSGRVRHRGRRPRGRAGQHLPRQRLDARGARIPRGVSRELRRRHAR